MPDPDKLTSEEEIAQNKGKVLKALLEHGELTRKEIALKTDLTRDYPDGEFPAVSHLVNELEKENLIELCTTEGCEKRRLKRELEKIKDDPNVKDKYSPLRKPGPKPEVWIIKRDISTIHTIFNKYPTLQDSLREQEWVRDLIVENRLDIRDPSGQDIKVLEIIIELNIMLEQSRHFFKLCVNYEDLYGLAIEWKHYLSPASEKSPRKIAKQIKNDMGLSFARIIHYRNLFAFCYFMDEFDGKERDKGHKIVEWCTRERFHRMQENHRDVILSSIENVMIPTLNMFFDSEKTDVMETIRDNVQRYTALSTEIEHERKATEKTKQSEKIKQFRDSQREIIIDILKTLKSSEIVKKYYIIPMI
jgi:hypothetical protein